MESIAATAASLQPVVFGVYRDGDNNLDGAQERNVTDFIRATGSNPALKVIAEDTTSLARTPFAQGELRTESSVIRGGAQHIVKVEPALDMSNRATLAAFVSRTLDARAADPQFRKADVWLDLVDHGAGDGGGLQADSAGGNCMKMEDIAGAIADGKAQFLKTHPGANATITGVLANQCLMATLGFADALSRNGVRFLAASPETMLAPGVPSAKVAEALTHGGNWADQVVQATMQARYGSGLDVFHPAAAFDVFDLDPAKMASVRSDVRAFNDSVVRLRGAEGSGESIHAVRSDIRGVPGMARFDHSADMIYHSDRPAEAVYDRIAADQRLPDYVRGAAGNAAQAVRGIVLSHEEYGVFSPFHASYADAAGPTEHLPLNRASYDPWAGGGVTETHNGFFDAVHGRQFARAIGAYNARDDAAGAVA